MFAFVCLHGRLEAETLEIDTRRCCRGCSRSLHVLRRRAGRLSDSSFESALLVGRKIHRGVLECSWVGSRHSKQFGRRNVLGLGLI